MTHVLITGHRGFVGSSTARALQARGDRVSGFDVSDGDDIRDLMSVYKAISLAQPDVILHEAAIARFADADADPVLAHEVNTLGTKNVADVAGELGVPLVFASTGSVYMPVTEDPPITEDFPTSGNSIYGVTKLLAEEYVRRAKVSWIILRYAHLYGADKIGHGLIGGFRAAIDAGRHPTLLGGAQTNDFTYIDDVVAANLAAIDANPDAWNSVYNIGTGVELSALDAGRIICDVFGYHGEIDVRPPRSVDPLRFVYDVSRAERYLGFRAAFGFRDGLERMVQEAAA